MQEGEYSLVIKSPTYPFVSTFQVEMYGFLKMPVIIKKVKWLL